MVRGRKKDLTVPPTRQLTQQRDYRARKAQYLSELEQRCFKAEEENVRLRRELELVRATMPFGGSPQEVVQISSELLRDLVNASASIARFQQITATRAPVPPDDNSFHHRQPPESSYSPPAGPSSLRPSSPPRQAPSHPVTITPSHVLQELRARPAPPHRMLAPIDGQRIDRTPASSSASSQAPVTSPSPSPGSEECCGGYLDCSELIEEKDDEEDEEEGEEDEDFGMYHFAHTSKVRFSQGDFRKDAAR